MIKPLFKLYLVFLVLLTFPFAGFCQVPVPKWVDNLGGAGDSKPTAIAVDKQNNVYVAGYFSSTVNFNPTPPGVKNLTSVGGYDIYVAKYTSAGALIWAISIGGSGLDQVNNMTVDANGNPTITGQYDSPTLTAGSLTFQNAGAEDIFIIHMDTNGNILWGKSLGGPQTDRGEEISSDAQGDLVETAIFQSSFTLGGKAISSPGGLYNGLVIKYDSSGNLLWDIVLGGAGDTEVYGNGEDSSGNIVVSGSYSGSVDFDPLGAHNVLNNGANTVFIAKYTPAGKLIWVNTVNGSVVINESALCIDPSGNIHFIGSFTSPLIFNGSTTLNPQGQDMFLAKYASNGVFQYANDLGGPGATAFAYQIRSDASDNICITGYFSGTINFNPSGTANVSYHGQRDFFLANYDTNGKYLWAFSGGSPNCNLTLGLRNVIDSNNNILLAGSFCSTVNFDPSGCSSDNITAINNTSDRFIAKYAAGSASIITNNVITAPAVSSFCGNGTPSSITGSTPSGGNGSYSYQWQTSTDGINFVNIAGATLQNYTPAVISANTYYRRTVSAGPCAPPENSNILELKILPVVAGNTITAPAVTDFCTNGTPSSIAGSTPTGGNGTYSYQWQSSIDGVNFTNITGATAKNYTPPLLTVTTYYRRTVISGVCTTPLVSNAITLTITSPPAVPIVANVSICSGSVATVLVASPQQGITYDWYDSSTKTNHLFTGAVYVSGPLTANETLYIEATNGVCSSPSLASAKVTVNGIPAAPVVVNNKPAVCNGSVATLSITNPQGGDTYNWYAASTGGSALSSGADFATPALTANITYYVEAVNSTGCVSTTRTPVNVTVNAIPQVTAQNTSVCPGSAATLAATSTDNNAAINWYAASTGGSILFTGNNFTTPVINSSVTYYAGAVDNSTGCVSASRAAISVQLFQQLAAPVVTVSSTTASTVTFQWEAVSGATGYQVSIDNGQTFIDPSSGSDGLTHTVTGLQPDQSVTIIVRATGAQPCELSNSSTAVTALAINPAGNLIYVPNAFTPNGDGKNDIVYVHSESIRSLKFYIYDQWGELIFTSTNQQNGWDGTFKGTKEPVGVYVYYLEAIMNDGQQVNKKGTITLLR